MDWAFDCGARSMTHIDQKMGEATCWSRLSYYAGLAPAGGLTFSSDTLVVPLEVQPVASMEGGPRRAIDWTRTDPSRANSPLEQRLSEGWLNSRTPTQLITGRIRKSKTGLEIHSAQGESKTPQAKNLLGSTILQLMLTDDEGNEFTASSIPASATVQFDKISSTKSLLELFATNQPKVPNATSEPGHNGFFGLNRRRPYYQGGVYAPTGYISPNSPMFASAPRTAVFWNARSAKSSRQSPPEVCRREATWQSSNIRPSSSRARCWRRKRLAFTLSLEIGKSVIGEFIH